MAPGDQEESRIGSGASGPLDELDRNDPPPPPDHISDTPEQVAQNEARLDDWTVRNLDYLKSFDSRNLRHLPLLSRLWGYDYGWYNSRIIFEVTKLSSWAGRRLTPDEMSIFTSHAARGVVAASYDRPIAIGATAFALWHGRSSYRMPFYQPRFTRFMHPQATRRPFFSSLIWHSARVGVYGLIGFTAYRLLSPRYRSYMIDSCIRDALDWELGLGQIEYDIHDNLQRLDKERSLRLGKTK